MRVLLVSDLHYDLRKLDWVLAESSGVDLLVMAGDLLDIGSSVPLDTQIVVVLEYLDALRRKHHHGRVLGQPRPRPPHRGGREGDRVDRRGANRRRRRRRRHRERRGMDDHGLRLVGGARDARRAGVLTRRGRPHARRALDLGLARPSRRSALVDGLTPLRRPRAAPTPRLPTSPDIVLCGHIHQAPFVPGGAWAERRDATWLFNGGHQIGPIPTHIFLDLHEGTASWWSFGGSGELSLGGPAIVG